MAAVIVETDDAPFRWHAQFIYRTEKGPLSVEHDLCELDVLPDLVENGPHWDAIDAIVVTRAGGSKTITVEEAAKL